MSNWRANVSEGIYVGDGGARWHASCPRNDGTEVARLQWCGAIGQLMSEEM